MTKNEFYKNKKIDLTKDEFTNGNIEIYSPLIIKKIKEETIKENIVFVYKSDYLEDLAKVHIFMDEHRNKTENILLGQLFEEQLFATYEFAKNIENKLDKESLTFDDFFNEETFKNYIGILTDNTALKETDTTTTAKEVTEINKKYISFNTNCPLINVKEYSLSLQKSGTHETQHFVSDDGSSNGFNTIKKMLKKNVYINEMCTEHFAIQIIEDFIEDKKITEKDYTRTLIPSGKTISFKSKSDVYMEITQFFDALDIASGNNFKELYYKKNLNIENLDKDFVKELQKLSNTYTKLYKNKDIENKNMQEKEFDNLINIFSDIAKDYIKNKIGVNKDTDLDELTNYSKAKSLKQFFDTFDNITFSIDGGPTYGNILKEKIILSIYENKEKAKKVFKDLENLFKDNSSSNASEIASIETEKIVSNDISNISEKDIIKNQEESKKIHKELKKDTNVNTKENDNFNGLEK